MAKRKAPQVPSPIDAAIDQVAAQAQQPPDVQQIQLQVATRGIQVNSGGNVDFPHPADYTNPRLLLFDLQTSIWIPIVLAGGNWTVRQPPQIWTPPGSLH